MLEQRLSATDIRIDGLQTRVVQQHTQQQSNTTEFAYIFLSKARSLYKHGTLNRRSHHIWWGSVENII